MIQKKSFLSDKLTSQCASWLAKQMRNRKKKKILKKPGNILADQQSFDFDETKWAHHKI